MQPIMSNRPDDEEEKTLNLPIQQASLANERPNRCGEGNIILHERKQLKSEEQTIICLYATHEMARTRDPDALALTVHNAWDQLLPSTITKIFNRIPKLLEIMISSILGGE